MLLAAAPICFISKTEHAAISVGMCDGACADADADT